MPALSFKKQFCPLVESGEKTHSLRAKRKRAWKVGDYLPLYYAMRAKQCRLLGKMTVTGVQDVSIHLRLEKEGEPFGFDIIIDGELLSADESESFARRDGFPGLAEMRLFWVVENKMQPGSVWLGDLIHWKFPFKEPDHA